MTHTLFPFFCDQQPNFFYFRGRWGGYFKIAKKKKTTDKSLLVQLLVFLISCSKNDATVVVSHKQNV